MNNRIVVVLGGNAFVRPGKALTMSGQFDFAQSAMAQLGPLLEDDCSMVVTHGNGPQVGHILTRVEEALGKAYAIPLEVCVAESEGELGYVLEQSLYNVLAERGSQRPLATLLTQVVVDASDPAFGKPTKPIGPFYTREEADRLAEHGFTVREDAGRGFRRVVSSPEPREILGVRVVERLLDDGVVVIAAGGGGIPVVRREGRLHGVEAVVDKDRSSALLGMAIDARRMVILTGVPCAYRHFNTPRQSPIGRVGVTQARALVDEGHFAPGSMRPKIEAAIHFADRPGARAVICDPASLERALAGEAGTTIEYDGDEARAGRSRERAAP